MAALSRLDAVQCPVLHLYRKKELGFVLKHTGAEYCIVPGEWKGFDYTAMADELAADLDPSPVVLTLGSLPTGDPSTLPPAANPADGDEPVSLDLLHAPAPPRTRRACSTPTRP